MGFFGDIISTSINAGINKQIADQNLAYQKENLEYQKALQQTIFQREDNAVQRRAKDLQNAGLSKTLAAGQGAGAGAVVSTQAPQNQYRSEIQLPDILQTLSQIESYKQQKYNLDYAEEHGLPYGVAPNATTELIDLIYKGLDMFGGKKQTYENIKETTKNAFNDLGFQYLFDNNMDTWNKIKAMVFASSGYNKDGTPQTKEENKDSNFKRNLKYDENGKPINPYQNPSAYLPSLFDDSPKPKKKSYDNGLKDLTKSTAKSIQQSWYK